ncbi:MAG TPA: PEP-CTERM-box response regulator transcription factor [Chromatiales bacterium]|nr:PEP-CTERM-box response regulator transcription factor [Chromatiales bacterium]HEX21836.1 PEP-CTERM-box response regulator transcription factor [Chromatiales bacterium]
MARKPKLKPLLVVEDDPGLQSQLRWCFDGYEVIIAGDREAAMNQLRKHRPAVVTLDLGLPPDPANASEGLATLVEILSEFPLTKVIVVTGNDDRENAVRAVSQGAYDFYQKPVEPEILGMIIDRAHALHDLEEEHRQLQQARISQLEGVIGASPQMQKACRMVEKVAPSDVTTLLLGESGTGKELFARSLHTLSPRSGGPFVAINCAAIPEALLESELFGYEKGAFTGASRQTKGKIEYAEGGTFFLDEVGDLPMALQAKMLRFLQERVIERVGGHKEIPVNVRIVCATHQDLPRLAEERKFREDLYYRISEISIRIPPLREREGDELMLARVFLDRFSSKNGRALKGFSREALDAIEQYPWPGNVRELENKMKRVNIMAEGEYVTAADLELTVGEDSQPVMLSLRQVREVAERKALQRALTLSKGNMSQAAELLEVSRPTLYDLLNKYGLK